MLNQCECKTDGFCPRYQRTMSGRFREICQGVNVDMGTAAVFREQWEREAGPSVSAVLPQPLLLKCDMNPGDLVAMTAAIYSLHRTHPGKYTTAVKCQYPEIFDYNPDVVPAAPRMSELRMYYPAIHKANERGIHFMQGWCEFLGLALGINIPLLTNRPRLYFGSHIPKVVLPDDLWAVLGNLVQGNFRLPDYLKGDYWIVCSGGKRDFTNKIWGHSSYQEVLGRLNGKVRFVQVGVASDQHQTLTTAVSMVGRTDLRYLFELVRRAKGVLCGVSLLMHVAAALEKPAIVIAGGREPVQWNAYPKQHYLHTVGALPCCAEGGCWKSRTVPLVDGSPLDSDLCERPIGDVPECMTMIKPSEVAELILRYNR
jgi:hypothetical protein